MQTGSEASAVIELILRRRDERSRPGARRDDHQVALVIEGGGERSAFSAGMVMALEELGLTHSFDDVYGTSGGALNGAWLLTGEACRRLPQWSTPAYAKLRITDPRRVLRGGPLVDLERLLEHVYPEVFGMDYAKVLGSPVRLHPMATHGRTGAATDLHPLVTDEATLRLALRASASLPLLAGRPVRLGAERFVDGGLAEPVPFHAALAGGASHVLVLRTRTAEQSVTRPARVERLVMSTWLAAYAPGARTAYLRRHLSHLEDEQCLAGGGLRAVVAQVRPAMGSRVVERLATNAELVQHALGAGREALLAAVQQAVPKVQDQARR